MLHSVEKKIWLYVEGGIRHVLKEGLISSDLFMNKPKNVANSKHDNKYTYMAQIDGSSCLLILN